LQAPSETADAPVFISKAELLKRVPVSAVTIWSWIRHGNFPAPKVLSKNKVAWDEAEVAAWMRARPVRRYKPVRSS
jgi:prophage regulatory protein